MRDLKSNIGFDILLAPAARTASANGASSDLKGYEGVAVVFLPGTITDGTHTPKLQESDDNSTFTDVAAADQLGAMWPFWPRTRRKRSAISASSATSAPSSRWRGLRPAASIRASSFVASRPRGPSPKP